MTAYIRRRARRLRLEARTCGDLERAAGTAWPRADGSPSFTFSFAGRLGTVLSLFGVRRANSRLRITDGRLRVHFGPWCFGTPLTNLAAVRLAEDRVTLVFREPVHGHEPIGLRHRSLTLRVTDPGRLADALRVRVPRLRDGP
ncbi:hypothetical protein [Prauserella shujinwangii]|uniref:hypothetical protein n=1 Tax=Prauserella shujinwangii TaxID=1453103 RepID=UPI0011B2298F|nr:hypothetical protein [Prauserella shujinwangii]